MKYLILILFLFVSFTVRGQWFLHLTPSKISSNVYDNSAIIPKPLPKDDPNNTVPDNLCWYAKDVKCTILVLFQLGYNRKSTKTILFPDNNEILKTMIEGFQESYKYQGDSVWLGKKDGNGFRVFLKPKQLPNCDFAVVIVPFSW